MGNQDGGAERMKERSMSAAETNVHFREHDIEFLQKRTKLWLEAVLGEKYGDRTLSEMISNGNLLYRVSQHITKEMTGASPGPREVSPRTVAQLDKKHSGKYLPYANVDAFLKVCRKVGLTDVELFSPPDAVEGKDIRQVCTSIRSLARKARAQQIRVPDFEDVNRPLPMTKEKIEEIKENLQHSHSSPASPIMPEADIKKSERVQIIARFLSTTTNPLYVPGEYNTSRSQSAPTSSVTPGRLKSYASTNSPLSTPSATIGGVDTPTLTKTVSDIGPSPAELKSATDCLALNAQSKSSDEAQTTPSPASPGGRPNDFPLFSQKALGSFKHAKPHFIKRSSSQSNEPASAEDPHPPAEGTAAAPHPEAEKTPSSRAASTPSSPAVPTPATPAVSKPLMPAAATSSATPAVSKPETPAKSSDRSADSAKELPTLAHLVSKPSSPGRATPSKTETVAKSPDGSPERAKELPTLAQLGLGAYRHASPHFSFKKSSQSDLGDLQPEEETPRGPDGKSRAPSSNKIAEKDSRSNSAQQIDASGRTSFGSANKGSQGSSAPAKEPTSKPEARVLGMQLNPRLWVPLVTGALAFVGTLVLVRTREPNVYEVKEGDTLSKISKQVGKKGWDELVKLNPSIADPDLIYPSARLKLPSK